MKLWHLLKLKISLKKRSFYDGDCKEKFFSDLTTSGTGPRTAHSLSERGLGLLLCNGLRKVHPKGLYFLFGFNQSQVAQGRKQLRLMYNRDNLQVAGLRDQTVFLPLNRPLKSLAG